jgi:hypothetical protein
VSPPPFQPSYATLMDADSVHEAFLVNGTFQQYTIIDANFAAKVRSEVSCVRGPS